MRVASLRFSHKFALEHYGGNRFETKEISVEAFPSDGQTAEDLLAEAEAFVKAHTPGNGTPAPPLAKPAEPPKHAPPPAAGGAPQNGSDPTMKSGNGATPGTPPTNGATKPEAELPKEPTGKKPGKKKGGGRPSKAYKEAKAAVQHAMEAPDTDELLNRLMAAASKSDAIALDEWEQDLFALRDRYPILNSQAAATEETQKALVEFFTGQRTLINNKRSPANGSAQVPF